MIGTNIENTKNSKSICQKCGGKYAHITDNKLRQELVLEEFGQIGSHCPSNTKGYFHCPYRK